MNAFEISIFLFFGSLFAGFLGALSGLGGGIVIVPLLVLGLGVDFHYAIGASLIAVIATSSGASSAFIREGFSNIRVAILLETATTIGAIGGVALGSFLPTHILFVSFGLVLLYCAISSFFSNGTIEEFPQDKLSEKLRLDGGYPSLAGWRSYHLHRIPTGYCIMFIAGLVSGTLGIGSGALKVLALDKIMGLPFKVSATTSNFMIGVTAAASAGLYLNLGYIDPFLTMPILLGVAFGALIGARLMPKMRTPVLRNVFSVLITIIAAQMLYNGFTRGS